MTRFLEYVGEALGALLRNKTRSILTMIGMVIGVAAVISVYGLSTGAAQGINASVNSSNNPSLTIVPDPKQANLDEAAIHFRDAALIDEQLSGAASRVTPVYSYFSNRLRSYQLKFAGKHVTAEAFSWYGGDANFKVVSGRAFSEEDERRAANVAIISHELAYEFWRSDDDAVGQYLTVHGTRFPIVGVANSDDGTASNYMGGGFWFALPYTTYHNFDPGNADVLYIWTTPDQEEFVRTTAVKELQRIHGPHAKYTVQSNREALAVFQRVIDVIAVSLTAIGAISLFVAGVGIMNIMLVSVTERTREIGIRKSIGASRRDIVLQFIIEAALMSLIGGLIGMGLSFLILWGASAALTKTLGALPIPYGRAAIYSMVFSIVVGLLFGVYPAQRASRMDPVEALRT
ncbi:MAG: ABC transporter permease [Candidatus Eremiobacteraeota bacterium]|nr:ABC transporter permease [Candidatus Eremiobacteraeota bacterium]